MKCKKPHLEFELKLLCPFSMTATITALTSNIYIYIYIMRICICNNYFLKMCSMPQNKNKAKIQDGTIKLLP